MSLVRSLASLCRRRVIRLGYDTAAHLPALDRRRLFLSSGRPRQANGGLSFRETTSSSADGTGPPAASFFSWARLAIGSVIAVTAPFLHSKWSSFLRIRNEVEMVKDAAETAAEVVEEVAAAAEMVSAEVAGQLPEDARLRRAAVLVEHASKEVAEEAHLARDIIHKVDEIEEEVKAIIEPIVDHGNRKTKHCEK